MIKKIFDHIFVSQFEISSDKRKILWLLNLRAIFLLSQILFIFPLLILKNIHVINMPIFLGLIFLSMVFNFLMYGIIKNIKENQYHGLLKMNFLFDLVITSLVLGIIQQSISLSVDGVFYVFLFLSIFLFQNKENHIFCSLVALAYLVQKLFFYHSSKKTMIEFEFVELASFIVCWIIVYNINMILKNKERQFNSLSLQAEKIDRLKSLGALSSGFSHEFASPLNSLQLSFDRIKRKFQIDENEKKNIEMAFQKCQKVIKDINSSFLVSGEDADSVIDLSEIIGQSINTCKIDNELIIQNKINAKVFYRLPKLNFIQVLVNIIENSYQAKNDSVINVDVKKDNEKEFLIIKDNGPGFSSFVLERFGEPFLTTKKDGTGLGLYTLKIFALSIGGNVKIFNQEIGGACIQIELPNKRKVYV